LNFATAGPDGSIREVEVFSSRIAVHGKDLLHSIVHDVSARKQIEEALKERDVRFRKLSDHVPGMIYQFLRGPTETYCVPFHFGIHPRTFSAARRRTSAPILMRFAAPSCPKISRRSSRP
jgi:hypothetical protein